MTIEIVAFALAVLVLNVMDSVTTNLGFRQYPDRELRGEANPAMRWLMLKSKVVAEVLKQGFVIGAVSLILVQDDALFWLRYVAVMLGLVVLNNTYVFVSRAITKRKVISPLKALEEFLHIPDKYVYAVTVVILLFMTTAICWLLWG